MLTISEIIQKLIQFNGTERVVYVKRYVRDSEGNVLSSWRYPVVATYSHNVGYAEIIIEDSQGKRSC